MPVKDGPSCPGCGLANYEGLCPVCRGDEAATRAEGLPYPFDDEAAPERRAPVQRDARGTSDGTIPWSTHEAAWSAYAEAGHGRQSAERIAERGGFGYREVQCALAGHYNDVPYCRVEHPVPAGWEAR